MRNWKRLRAINEIREIKVKSYSKEKIPYFSILLKPLKILIGLDSCNLTGENFGLFFGYYVNAHLVSSPRL